MYAHVPTVTPAVDPDILTVAAAVLAGGLATLILAVVLADRRGLLPRAAVPFGRWIAMVVAGLSIGAASIHFAVIGAHFDEWPPYGVAFVALAWFQAGWAVAYLLAPGRRVALVAIAVNAGALAVWAASRTVGLPFGPAPGLVEPVGPLDVAAGLMEVALIGVLAWHLGAIGARLRPALPRAGAAIVLGTSALAVVLLTTTAFVAAGGDAHGEGHELPPTGEIETPSGPLIQPSSGASVPSPTDDSPTTDPSAPVLPAESIGGSGALADPSTAPGSGTPQAATPSPTTAPAPASASPSQRPTSAGATLTPRPATPRPTQPSTPPPANPGTIRFGTSLGPDGEIANPTARFGEGETAIWIAEFSEAPNASTVRLFIIQVLPDGREFEHWREEIAVDPDARRFVGRADLSIYLHGGEGRHLMRYLRGDTLLAEGAFDLVR